MNMKKKKYGKMQIDLQVVFLMKELSTMLTDTMEATRKKLNTHELDPEKEEVLAKMLIRQVELLADLMGSVTVEIEGLVLMARTFRSVVEGFNKTASGNYQMVMPAELHEKLTKMTKLISDEPSPK